MGVEVLSRIASWFDLLLAFRTSSEVLALIGFMLVGIVCMVYVGRGILLLGKWLINLRVNEFLLALALVGFVLIALAVVIP